MATHALLVAPHFHLRLTAHRAGQVLRKRIGQGQLSPTEAGERRILTPALDVPHASRSARACGGYCWIVRRYATTFFRSSSVNAGLPPLGGMSTPVVFNGSLDGRPARRKASICSSV